MICIHPYLLRSQNELIAFSKLFLQQPSVAPTKGWQKPNAGPATQSPVAAKPTSELEAVFQRRQQKAEKPPEPSNPSKMSELEAVFQRRRQMSG